MYLEVALQILYMIREPCICKYYYLAPKDIFISLLRPGGPEDAAR
jgi:hypothetical protein